MKRALRVVGEVVLFPLRLTGYLLLIPVVSAFLIGLILGFIRPVSYEEIFNRRCA